MIEVKKLITKHGKQIEAAFSESIENDKARLERLRNLPISQIEQAKSDGLEDLPLFITAKNSFYQAVKFYNELFTTENS